VRWRSDWKLSPLKAANSRNWNQIFSFVRSPIETYFMLLESPWQGLQSPVDKVTQFGRKQTQKRWTVWPRFPPFSLSRILLLYWKSTNEISIESKRMKRWTDWDKFHAIWWPEEGEMAGRRILLLFTTGTVTWREFLIFGWTVNPKILIYRNISELWLTITSSYELRFGQTLCPRIRIDELYNVREESFPIIQTERKVNY
jgi:hypothetical protein